MKHQKQESLGRQASQDGSHRPERKHHHRIKRKPKNRQITHYFSRVQRKPSSQQPFPAPEKGPAEQIDYKSLQLHEEQLALLERRDQLLRKLQAQKEDKEHYMTKIRATISQELIKSAQIDRLLDLQKYSVISEKQEQLEKLRESVQNKQKIVIGGNIEGLQRFFLMKELNRLKQQINLLQLQITTAEEQQRLCREEEGCYFSKYGWPLLAKRYQLLRLIGKGGFSEVYSAYDLDNHHPVAVKLSDVQHLLAGRGNKNDYLRHIKRQYEVHKQLSHPNIVRLVQVLQLQSAICIVLQYCEGETLAQLLTREGRLPESEAKMIIRPLLQVVRYLSLLRPIVVHYDLKPQNVMFQNGVVKVLDFGVCKTIDGEHSKMALTSQGMGTHCYLPPETFVSNNPMLSNKVDVWSIGVMFYEMVCGCRPFGQGMNGLEFGEVELSQQGRKFIRDCLEVDLMHRVDPVTALNEQYFGNQ